MLKQQYKTTRKYTGVMPNNCGLQQELSNCFNKFILCVEYNTKIHSDPAI